MPHIDPDENFFANIYDLASGSNSNYETVHEYNLKLKNGPEVFTCVNYNIRSFSANFDTFANIFHENSMPDIITLTETWFKEYDTQEIPGYKSYHVYRSERRSGGVSIYVKESVCSFKIDNFSYVNSNLEICTVCIYLNNVKHFIFGIYRPHSGTIDSFKTELDIVLQNPMFSEKTCIALGDFNINLMQDSVNVNGFVDNMQVNHFIPLITKPTRFSEQSQPSLLDQIWLKNPNSFTCGIIIHDLTDHWPVYLRIPILKSPNKTNDKIKITFRLINSQTKALFERKISQFNWNSIEHDDINIYTANFLDKLNEIFQSCCPVKVKLIPKKRMDNPWITSATQKLIQAKSQYFLLYKRGIVSKSENNSFKNKVKSILFKVKEKYYKDLFQKNKNSIKNTWSVIRSIALNSSRKSPPSRIIHDNVEIINNEDIAEVFNSYFSEIPIILNSNLPSSNLDPLSFVKPNTKSSMHLWRATAAECTQIIKSLKNTKVSPESLPVFLLKENAEILAPIIRNIINRCFSSGIFPDLLKIALITPVFKKGDPLNVKNFRPISVLLVLSKIFEKSMYSRLVRFLDSAKILNDVQFGFRKGLSTETAILKLTEYLYEILNSKKCSLEVFIDFQKAFDTIDHEILFNKMSLYGIRGKPLGLFRSFLTGRKQRVKIDNVISSTKPLTIGLPQGSTLSAILYLIYINDLPNFSSNCQQILYADDTTLCFQNKNISDMTTICNNTLTDFSHWAIANRLTINPEKTQCMLFANIQFPENIPSVTLNHRPIESVDSFKFLGVVLDPKIKFNLHIQMICNKISKSIGIIRKISNYVSTSTLISLYYSLIYPYLTYCNLTWGSTYDSHLIPLITLQKKAIRVINKVNYLEHTSPLFFANKILKLPDLIKYRQAIHIFKNLSQYTTPSHSYSTRTSSNLIVPFQRLTLGQHSLAYCGPTTWNSLPDYIKSADSLPIFKRLLREHFLLYYVAQNV